MLTAWLLFSPGCASEKILSMAGSAFEVDAYSYRLRQLKKEGSA